MEQVESEVKISMIIAKVSDENRTLRLSTRLEHEIGMEADQA